MSKTTIVGLTIALLAGFFLGYGVFHTSPEKTVAGANSAVGTTNTSAKLFTVTMAPLTAAATTTSILNPFGVDVAVTSTFAYCNGLGTSNAFPSTGGALASLLVQMATTSTANGGLLGNANYVGNLTIATTTTTYYVSSTTEPIPNYLGRLWSAGTYMSITFNATNTAACTVGGHIIAL